MTAPIALDLTRLALGPVRHTPRGIDRVELAYAQHFLNEWPGECIPVLPVPWGMRSFNRSQALDGLAALEKLWREKTDHRHDVSFARAVAFLNGNPAVAPALRQLKPTIIEQARGFLSLLAATGVAFGRSAVRALPNKTLYLNVGQLEVYRPALSWLKRRPDVASVFMIYDLIPLELPEHHLSIGIKLHHRIVQNSAEFAQALIVPSHSVGLSVSRELRKHGRVDVPTHVELLPVPSEFLGTRVNDADLVGTNYFVICGAIDSYKNHLLLLKIWPKLIERFGLNAPKLVIAGSAGVTSRSVIEWIENSPSLRTHVLLCPRLSTPSLRRLITSARGLLMPSLAEGFGLPIVEALAQGVPVIASDIPAHREAGAGADVIYVSPTDNAGWVSQIASLTLPLSHEPARIKPYAAKTWADYFGGIEGFLLGLTN